ncbi:Ig-like domain repeat protein [Nocardioides caeni]|uniref:Bacterial Ig-like domain-containing protein n=1 Tax=Nocardioides caeni TaxID=574700 RepID=A0A4S8NN75_9ACTN|nr:Ig-like domain repeat protein [Nocardioides caeni]THV17931.1 hypothetical protein E9934_05615 [Nocardioides caeni]
MTTILNGRHARRGLAGVAAAALAGAALASTPAPARAGQTGDVDGTATASWAVSELARHYRMGLASLRTETGDGATCVDANPDALAMPTPQPRCSTIDWADGEGGVDPVTGVTTLSYDGHFTIWASTGNQWVRIADPEFTFDSTGTGSVTAEVSYGTTTASTWVEPPVAKPGNGEHPGGAPTRVEIVDLLANPNPTPGDASYDDYPYANGFSTTVDEGTTTFANLRGLWAPELVTHLAGPDGVADGQGPGASSDGFVYHTTFQNLVDGSSRVRYPAPFTLTAEVAAAQTAVSLSTDSTGINVGVEGTGFLKTAPGVYVSLREYAAGDPAYTGGSVGDMDGPTAWVGTAPGDLTGTPAANAIIGDDGAFSTSIHLGLDDLAALDAEKLYSVVTRKAHGQGTIPANASQVTETPVDASELIALRDSKSTTGSALTAPVATYGAPATVTVDVAQGGGTVSLAGIGNTPRTADVVDGTATFALPATLAVGTYPLTATTSGDDATWGTTAAGSLVVKKTTSRFTVLKAGPVPTTKRTGRARVTLATGSGHKVAARAILTLKKGKVTRKVAVNLRNGTALVNLPKLAKGNWSAIVTWTGNANVARPAYRKIVLRVTR